MSAPKGRFIIIGKTLRLVKQILQKRACFFEKLSYFGVFALVMPHFMPYKPLLFPLNRFFVRQKSSARQIEQSFIKYYILISDVPRSGVLHIMRQARGGFALGRTRFSMRCLYFVVGTRTLVPPIYGCKTSGIVTVPSACRWFSKNAISIRGGATQVLFSVWAR